MFAIALVAGSLIAADRLVAQETHTFSNVIELGDGRVAAADATLIDDRTVSFTLMAPGLDLEWVEIRDREQGGTLLATTRSTGDGRSPHLQLIGMGEVLNEPEGEGVTIGLEDFLVELTLHAPGGGLDRAADAGVVMVGFTNGESTSFPIFAGEDGVRQSARSRWPRETTPRRSSARVPAHRRSSKPLAWVADRAPPSPASRRARWLPLRRRRHLPLRRRLGRRNLRPRAPRPAAPGPGAPPAGPGAPRPGRPPVPAPAGSGRAGGTRRRHRRRERLARVGDRPARPAWRAIHLPLPGRRRRRARSLWHRRLRGPLVGMHRGSPRGADLVRERRVRHDRDPCRPGRLCRKPGSGRGDQLRRGGVAGKLRLRPVRDEIA